MDKLHDLKSWMKPRLKKLVCFINRLELRLEKQARQRQRARRMQAPQILPLGKGLQGVDEAGVDDGLGRYSIYDHVRNRYPGFGGRLD